MAPSQVTKLSERLQELHQAMKALHPNLARIAIALYNADTDLVSTYAYSSDTDNPLLWYSYPLSQCRSLKQLANTGKSRVINDMTLLANSRTVHTQALLDTGYRSSYTLPIRQDGRLVGFVFFNSIVANDFSKHLLPHLEMSAYAISLLVIQITSQFHALHATMKTAVEVTHVRDPETGEHLRRMTNYTRFISSLLGPKLNLSDEYISHLVLFSSLHDIGKISIPDNILLKPGQLTADEFEVMKCHPSNGRKIIDKLIDNHALDNLDHIDMLRNIIEFHHENWDGSGYPNGLAGEAIPLEARIIAVCDAFDAITSERPYKKPIDSTTALEMIADMRGNKLDPLCADQFLQHPEQIDAIRRKHKIDGENSSQRSKPRLAI